MQKQKRWQFVLILAVTALTIYNILPTIFYYTKPLSASIDKSRGDKIAVDIVKRINSLEEDSLKWVDSFCDLLQLKTQSIELDPKDPEIISISFQNPSHANVFKDLLPRAGALIPFTPAQLSLYGNDGTENKTVKVQRKIATHFNSDSLVGLLHFSTKRNDQGQISPVYYSLVKDRLSQIALSLGSVPQNTQFVQALKSSNDPVLDQELATSLADSLVSFVNSFGQTSPIAQRFFSSFTQTENGNRKQLAQDLYLKLDHCSSSISQELNLIAREEETLKDQGKYLESSKIQMKQLYMSKITLLNTASAIIKNNLSSFANGPQPWTSANIGSISQEYSLQPIPLEGRNPFIESIYIDWRNEKIVLNTYADLLQLKQSLATQNPRQLEKAEQFLFNEIATLSRKTEESISPLQNGYEIALSQLPNSNSFLAFRLASIAQAQAEDIRNLLSSSWNPQHPDLQPNAFPILDYDSYLNLPSDQRNLSLLIYAPVSYAKTPEMGFRMNSVYVIAKGMDKIVKKLEEDPSSKEAQVFMQDFQRLKSLLQNSGFMGYEGSILHISKEFAGDFIFESPDYFQNVLAASRENFTVKGSKRFAVLEFTNVEQRILTENKIDTRIHEDLLKWRDDYLSAQLSIKGASKFDVPKPTTSPFLSNLKLSFIKYFRGDDRKILHWGLDLSGGKTVQIELRDANNRVVTNETDIAQGINELYSRVNKMGVSEVNLRQEGHLITLDFPGSQNLSASELVKASSMYFHVVNEKFTNHNPMLAEATNKFLQEVWNEAVVNNKQGAEAINLIAWKHLYGNALDPDLIQPRTESARILYENGLRLANPLESETSSSFNDTLSQIALFRGDDFTE